MFFRAVAPISDLDVLHAATHRIPVENEPQVGIMGFRSLGHSVKFEDKIMAWHLRQIAPSILLGLLLLSVSCSPDASRPRDSGKNQPLPGPSLGVVTESARSIPIVYDVDVVVVGGSSAGVAAAAAAARNGARVFLAAPRPYLGEDLCGTYRLWLEPDEEPRSDMAKALFTEPPSARQMCPPRLATRTPPPLRS